MRKKAAAKSHFPEIIQLHLLRYFTLSHTFRASKCGVVWVSCWATMSSRDDILLWRRWWSCSERNRLYFGPDQRLWENLLLSCCWRNGKWLLPSAVRRSLGNSASSSHPLTALTLPAAQLWIPKQGKPEKLHRFYGLFSATIFLYQTGSQSYFRS